MPDKIKNSLAGASRLEKRLGRITESIQELQDKIGHSPKEIFNPMVEERIAGARHSELLRHNRSLGQKLRAFYKIATPSQDFQASIDRTKSMLQHGISTARAVAMKRSFDREIASMGGKAGRSIGTGNAPRIQISQLELNNRVEAKKNQIYQQEYKVKKEIADIEVKGPHLNQERLSDLKKELDLLNSQKNAVSIMTQDNKKLLQDATLYSPWRTMGAGRRKRLNIPGDVPILEPDVGSHLLKGAKRGFGMMRPFGPIGEILGAGIGGVIGGAQGLFSRGANVRKIRGAQSEADARQMMLPGTEGGDVAAAGAGGALAAGFPGAAATFVAAEVIAKLASAGYNLAKSGFSFQKQGILTATGLGMGLSSPDAFSQFQKGTGLGFGINKTNVGFLDVKKNRTSAMLDALGVSPTEAMDMVSTYGALNTKNRFDLEPLARASRAPYLAGVGTDLLSQVGRFGTRATGIDNTRMFGALQRAVEEGVHSGMTAPEVTQTFLGLSKAMAMGTGVGMANAGGMFGAFNGMRGKIAAFNTPEGMVSAAGAMASAGSRAVSNPFGFALLQSGLLSTPGTTYKEKLQNVMPKGMFNTFWGGLTKNERGMMGTTPNFMTTMAMGKLDLMGPAGAIAMTKFLDKMMPGPQNYAARANILNGQIGNADATRFLLNASPGQMREFASGGYKKFDDTMSLSHIDDNTASMLDVLKVIAAPEAMKLQASGLLTGPVATVVSALENWYMGKPPIPGMASTNPADMAAKHRAETAGWGKPWGPPTKPVGTHSHKLHHS